MGKIVIKVDGVVVDCMLSIIVNYNKLGDAHSYAMNEEEAFDALTKYTPDFKKRFRELSISYNVNIITGSLPSIEEDSLRNIGYLCHRKWERRSIRKNSHYSRRRKILGNS